MLTPASSLHLEASSPSGWKSFRKCRAFSLENLSSCFFTGCFSPKHKTERDLVLPVPDCSEELSHINSFGFHLDHPRMFQHPPWRRAPGRFLFKATANDQQAVEYKSVAQGHTYEHSIKYLKFSLQRMSCPLGSPVSSRSLGIFCATMYVRRSMSPARGSISVPSAGKGKRF